MIESDVHHALDAYESRQLADALGDTPNTTIEVHALERNLGRAFVIGPPSRFEAALIEGANLPAEPHGFGQNPEALCSLLSSVHGWDCVLVDRGLSVSLEQHVRRELCPRKRMNSGANCPGGRKVTACPGGGCAMTPPG